jgi:hypothetical protein
VHLIKVRIPPTWKSPSSSANWHTITLVLSNQRDPGHNPLRMGEGLEQIMDMHCTCKGGLRTAALCTHRVGVLLLLCATACINVAKVPEALVVDTARSVLTWSVFQSINPSVRSPDAHQPLHSGPPTAYPPGGQAALWRLPARPPHATKETRQNILGTLLVNHGQRLPAIPLAPGHDQRLFQPQHRTANLRPGLVVQRPAGPRGNRGNRGNQNQQQNPALLAMVNNQNTCWAGAAFLVLTRIQVYNPTFFPYN